MSNEYEDKAMTVAQLIAELQKLPPELKVLTEGCDCTGPCASVSVEAGWNDDDPDLVMLGRT